MSKTLSFNKEYDSLQQELKVKTYAEQIIVENTSLTEYLKEKNENLEEALGRKKNNEYAYGYSHISAGIRWYLLGEYTYTEDATDMDYINGAFLVTRLNSSDSIYAGLAAFNILISSSEVTDYSFTVTELSNQYELKEDDLFITMTKVNADTLTFQIYSRSETTYDGFRIDLLKDFTTYDGSSLTGWKWYRSKGEQNCVTAKPVSDMIIYPASAGSANTLTAHITNANIHVSTNDRTTWNSKMDTAGTALEKSGTMISHSRHGSAGTYKSVTTDEQGHIISGSNPTTLNGYGISDAYTSAEVDNLFSTFEMATDWKESVNTYADIAKTYPEPGDGWTVNVKDTDYTYRWTGSEWVVISANAIPIATDELDGRMAKEHVVQLTEAYDKRHQHTNKAVLDTITQAELDKLSGIEEGANRYTHPDSGTAEGTFQSVTVNKQGHVTSGTNPTTLSGYGIKDAYTQAVVDTLIKAHADDTTVHISNTDRANWNDANSKKHEHSNKAVLDGITEELIEEWTSGGSESHSHANKTILDSITSTKVSNWDNAVSESHTHGNKNVLDTISQTTVDSWNSKLDTAGTGLSKSGTTINHSSSITAGNAGPSSGVELSYGDKFTVPRVVYDAQGHLTSAAAYTMTMPAAPTTVTGNAGTATKLAAAKTLSFTGDATGSMSFDGSANTSTALTLADSGVTAGSYGPGAAAAPGNGGSFNVPQVTVDAKGRITAANSRAITLPAAYSHPTFTAITIGETENKTLTYGGIFTVPQVGRDTNGHASTLTARTLTMPSAPATVSGNAGTATKLQTARTISYTGDASGSVSFDGSANVSTALTLAGSGVTAGSYGPSAGVSPGSGGSFNVPQVTVDVKGRVTTVSNRAITLPAVQTTITGNAGTATKLLTARTFTYTGDVTGTGSFDGSANVSINMTRTPLSAVTASISSGIISAGANVAAALTGITKVGSKLAIGSTSITVSGISYIEISGSFLFTDKAPETAKTITVQLLNGSAVTHSIILPINSVITPVIYDASSVTSINVITNGAWSNVTADYDCYLTVKEI